MVGAEFCFASTLGLVRLENVNLPGKNRFFSRAWPSVSDKGQIVLKNCLTHLIKN